MSGSRYHNIDASAFHKGQYVGYGGGTVWRITREGRFWRAIPRDRQTYHEFVGSLSEVSRTLEAMNQSFGRDAKRKRASYGRKTSHCDACGKERTDVQPWGEIGACWLCRKEGQRRRIWSHREGRYVYASQGFPYYESDRARRRKKRRR